VRAAQWGAARAFALAWRSGGAWRSAGQDLHVCPGWPLVSAFFPGGSA